MAALAREAAEMEYPPELDDDEPLLEETSEKAVTSEMATYVNAISRSMKK